MPRYHPIDVEPTIKASHSDLLSFRWGPNQIVAEFIIPADDSLALRVQFDAKNITTIARLLDEMPLSTEYEDTPTEGLVPGHLAYRVEGALFEKAQSGAWKQIYSPVHYRFITGGTCLDVLSRAAPTFQVVERSSPEISN